MFPRPPRTPVALTVAMIVMPSSLLCHRRTVHLFSTTPDDLVAISRRNYCRSRDRGGGTRAAHGRPRLRDRGRRLRLDAAVGILSSLTTTPSRTRDLSLACD